MNARKFLFGEDFRGAPQEERRDEAAIAAAESQGYARGYEAGKREATADAERRLEAAAQQIGQAMGKAFTEVDARCQAIETEALHFFRTLAEKLAAQALAAYPLAAIAEAAEEAFRHLRGVPHLAVRVHESLVEPVDALTRKMARERGYEGRIIVLGDDEIAPGDTRIEWADGGIVRERKDIDAALGAVLAAVGQPR
jgi:flagellar assembly protein FliH